MTASEQDRREQDRRDQDRRAQLKESYRKQLVAGIGGWSGALIAAIPTAVFVVVNVTTSLRPAIAAAVGSALLLTAYRFVRKQPVQQALSGLFGVVIAAVIAARTGQARGYFLVGIWTSFAYAVPFAVSVVLRRPLVGVLWEFLDPTPAPGAAEAADRRADDAAGEPVPTATDQQLDAPEAPPWHKRRPLLLAYTWATLAGVVVFLARGFVQLALYGANATGWLAFARIAMGYPLFIAAVGFAFLVVTRARRAGNPGVGA
ncbi:DUF3159 domain-containing protein [uncultured Jatrophihabitans sp.]|uniref:DUF3159 domain-containing protein n=1 Tax=uncultured Jatrophihabitans sp. TaxID=1610747 RepID=UPI0035CB8FE5